MPAPDKSIDKLSIDKLSIDKLSIDKLNNVTPLQVINPDYRLESGQPELQAEMEEEWEKDWSQL
ncbi:MAG: hypothetical protein JWP63_1536 [Candidatus Solibacter sp.]|jgi:hypothetical protein|nr:hypothetical protein [Candidatus Solibacter sp.]